MQSHTADFLYSLESLQHVVQVFVLPCPELFGASFLLSYRKPWFLFVEYEADTGKAWAACDIVCGVVHVCLCYEVTGLLVQVNLQPKF